MRKPVLFLSVLFALAAPAAAMAEDDIGFPQLKTDTYAGQVFWLFVSFIVLYALMSAIALPRVGRVLEARRAKQEGDLDQAAKANDEAEKVKSAYERSLAKAQAAANDARVAAERVVSEKISAAQGRFADDSRKRMAAAEQNIARAKAEALESLSDIAAEAAAGMVEKVAGVEIAKAEAKKAVADVMKG